MPSGAAHAQPVHGRVSLACRRARAVEGAQLDPAITVGRSQHSHVAAHTFEPDRAIDPGPLDRRFALELEPKLDKERDRRLNILTTMPTLAMRIAILRA